MMNTQLRPESVFGDDTPLTLVDQATFEKDRSIKILYFQTQYETYVKTVIRCNEDVFYEHAYNNVKDFDITWLDLNDEGFVVMTPVLLTYANLWCDDKGADDAV